VNSLLAYLSIFRTSIIPFFTYTAGPVFLVLLSYFFIFKFFSDGATANVCFDIFALGWGCGYGI
jgi:hypothetical protein